MYRKGSYKPFFHLQVGLKDDLDEIRLVASPSSNEWGFTAKGDVDINQKLFSKINSPIPVAAVHLYDGKKYAMVFGKRKLDEKKNKIILPRTYGYMGKKFQIDVNTIIRGNVPGSTFKHIDNIYMIGSRTVVLGKNHMELSKIYEPYGKTGFFLAPILAGWAWVPTKSKASKNFKNYRY